MRIVIKRSLTDAAKAMEVVLPTRTNLVAGARFFVLSAKAKGVSNCLDCAAGHASNAKRIYAFNEMEADHVTAWSKGGSTDETNCQMLCRHHNRVKGNA